MGASLASTSLHRHSALDRPTDWYVERWDAPTVPRPCCCCGWLYQHYAGRNTDLGVITDARNGAAHRRDRGELDHDVVSARLDRVSVARWSHWRSHRLQAGLCV